MTEDQDTPTAELTRTELWSQLNNAVLLVVKQDQIVWVSFGVFWAANAVLIATLFTSEGLPKWPVGFIVSTVGIVFSLVWLWINHRALAWLKFYEEIIERLEQNYLFVPHSIALFTRHKERVRGWHVRRIMRWFPLLSAVIWGLSAWYFWSQHC